MVATGDVTNLVAAAPLLLLVPLRLGVERLNPGYVHPLLSMFTLPQFVGFVGGQQSSSFFFVGAEIPPLSAPMDGACYYLDPHLLQENDLTGSSSYSVYDVGRMGISTLDPSLALGFYMRDPNEWEILSEALRALWATTDFPLFALLSAEDSLKLQEDPRNLEFAGDDFDMT